MWKWGLKTPVSARHSQEPLKLKARPSNSDRRWDQSFSEFGRFESTFLSRLSNGESHKSHSYKSILQQADQTTPSILLTEPELPTRLIWTTGSVSSAIAEKMASNDQSGRRLDINNCIHLRWLVKTPRPTMVFMVIDLSEGLYPQRVRCHLKRAGPANKTTNESMRSANVYSYDITLGTFSKNQTTN